MTKRVGQSNEAWGALKTRHCASPITWPWGSKPFYLGSHRQNEQKSHGWNVFYACGKHIDRNLRSMRIDEQHITAHMPRTAIYDVNDVNSMQISVNKMSAAVRLKKDGCNSTRVNITLYQVGLAHDMWVTALTLTMSSSHITHRDCVYVRAATMRAKCNEHRITAHMLRTTIYDANDVKTMEISVNKMSAAVRVKKRWIQFDSNQYNFIPRRFGTCHIQAVVYGSLLHELIAHLDHSTVDDSDGMIKGLTIK